MDLHISISGLIGAGKSTLCKKIASHLQMQDYYEAVADNPWLPQFYADMKRHAFGLQIHLLNQRYAQHQRMMWNRKGGVISDRTIYEDRVFAQVLREGDNMSQLEYETYLQLFDNMRNHIREPDIIIHLDVSPETAFTRIKERARGMETGITLEYLQALHRVYEKFIEDISKRIPVIRIQWNEFRNVEDVAGMIEETVKSGIPVRHF